MIDVRTVALSIAEELKAHPERWTQGVYARDADGKETDNHTGNVQCRCIMGHIFSRFPTMAHCSDEDIRVMRVMQSQFNIVVSAAYTRTDLNGFKEPSAIVNFNDTPGRTVAEIIAVCEKVAEENGSLVPA